MNNYLDSLRQGLFGPKPSGMVIVAVAENDSVGLGQVDVQQISIMDQGIGFSRVKKDVFLR